MARNYFIFPGFVCFRWSIKYRVSQEYVTKRKLVTIVRHAGM